MVFKIPTTQKLTLDALICRDPGADIIFTPKEQYKEYPCIHLDDRKAVSVIQPNIDRGPWIAGGAALQWFQGQPVGLSDIDVFCRNDKQAQAVISNLSKVATLIYRSDNAITFSMPKLEINEVDWRIQVIKANYYASVQEVIDRFDITVCQVATCGREWILGGTTAQDIAQRQLKMIEPLRPGAVKRLIKYWTYGYQPSDQLFDRVVNNPDNNWEFGHDEDYQ